MRITGFILAVLLTITALAQDRGPRAPIPFRVQVIARGPENAEIHREVIRELQKHRVAVASGRAEFGLQLAAMELSGACPGVAVAVLTTTPSGHDLQVVAGANWQEVAKFIVDRTKEDFERSTNARN